MTVDLAIFGNDPGAIKERLPKMIPMLLRELPKSAELIQQVIDFLPAIFIALPPTTGFPMMLATEFASIFHRNYGNDCGDKPILQKTIQAFIAFAQCSTPTLLAKETRYLLNSS
jgi:hypothetical protein